MLEKRWGSKKVKLGAESFREYDQCSLCLNRAESPVVCQEGHLCCKVCILSALLDQKREIALVRATLHDLDREHEAQLDRARAEAMEQVKRDFERVQSGVGRVRGEEGSPSGGKWTLKGLRAPCHA